VSGFFLYLPLYPNAQMAELVDALVSNTSNSNVVPVRPRLWVRKRRRRAQGSSKEEKKEAQVIEPFFTHRNRFVLTSCAP
jgi:hypothetical protein